MLRVFKWVMVASVAGMMLASSGLSDDATTSQGLTYAAGVMVWDFAVGSEADGKVWLSWVAEDEQGAGRFHIQRKLSDGTLVPVGQGYLHLRGDGRGVYRLTDPLAQSGDSVKYLLSYLPRHGQEQALSTWAGVIPAPRIEAKAMAQADPAMPLEPTQSPGVSRPQAWIGNGPRVRGWDSDGVADRVRLSLRTKGVYRVAAQELAQASGWDEDEVAAAITATNLALSCQGVPIAWLADGDSLLFFGVPAASQYAPENVYWVAREAGQQMAARTVTPPTVPLTNAWFTETIEFQGTNHLTRVSYNSRTDLPFVAYGLRTSMASLTVQESLAEPAPGSWTGAVSVTLLSYYEKIAVDDHKAQVSVGSTPVGVSSWSGERLVTNTYPFASSQLFGETASVTVANRIELPWNWADADYSRFLWMSSRFSYPRTYRARHGALLCRGGSGNCAAIAGFPSNDVVVLDVGTIHAPAVAGPLTVTRDATSGSWLAVFPCGGTGETYQAFSRSAGVLEPAVRGVRDVDWNSDTNAISYAILIPPEGWGGGYRQAVQPLADYRTAQGLVTEVIDVESLYNAYSHGLVDPTAIRSFCTAMYAKGLRYLLLAGAGSLDYKHLRLSVNDYTACLIPTWAASQRFVSSGEDMVVAMDGMFGDVTGDGLPDLAVGRMPTTRTQEVAVAVQKTLAFEHARRWLKPAVVTADWDWPNEPGKAYPFSAGANELVVPLGADERSVRTFYSSDSSGSLQAVRENHLLPALRDGVALFHYFGHGSERGLGNLWNQTGRLLRFGDITAENWGLPAIAVVMSCLPNRWQSPYTSTPECVLPYGLFVAGSGFVAGIGSTGYLATSDGENLPRDFYADLGTQGTHRLGDLWLRGIRKQASSMPRERLLSVNISGDPALTFSAPDPRLIIIIK